MIRCGFLILSGILFTSTAAAQSDKVVPPAAQPEPAGGKAQAGDSLPAGAAIRATISSSMDSKKLKMGDKVTAETTAATKLGDKVLVPSGAKLVGHVTHASARSKGDAFSSIGIAFDKAILKHNQEIPLNVSIQALASAPQMAASVTPSPDMSPGAGGMGSGAPGSPAPRPGVPSTMAPPPSANTSGNVEKTVGNTDTNNATSGKGAAGGLDNSGWLTPQSRGVFGLPGIGLAAGTAGAEPGTVITSTGKEVRLESGTQVLLITQAPVRDSN